MQLRFLLFSQPIIIRKMTFGGVLESSGSPLDDGHRDFENWCRNGWENWSWSWQPPFENWQKSMIDDVILKNYGANCRYSLVAVVALKVRLKVSSDYQQQRRWRGGGGRLSSGLLMVDRSGAGVRHRPVIADHWFLHLHQICDDRLQSINNTFKTCYILCDSWWILNNIWWSWSNCTGLPPWPLRLLLIVRVVGR